jgi:hypothetical protein
MGELFQRRKKDRRLVLTLPAQVAVLLRQVVVELGDMFAAPTPGAVSDRLFPRAYLDPTEEEAEVQWQDLVHDDLVQGRAAAVAAIAAALDGATPGRKDWVTIVIDGDEAETQWLTLLNDARLALGTVLGVTQDDPLVFPEGDPRAATAEVYYLLGAVQDDLIDVLLDDLPEAGTAGEPQY